MEDTVQSHFVLDILNVDFVRNVMVVVGVILCKDVFQELHKNLIENVPPAPVTTVTASAIAPAVRIVWPSSERPATSCNGLGRADFMREPSPAARMMAVVGWSVIAAFYSLCGVSGRRVRFGRRRRCVLRLV